MLCSGCSEVITPIVAVDIDGTLGDYHGHFLKFADQYLGAEGGDFFYDGSESFREWFCAAYGVETEEYRAIKLAYRQGGMKRSMPIREGAQDLCWAIRDAGAELWLTTTRPYLSLDNIVPDTVEWLRRHEIKFDGMLFDELKYQEFAKRVDTERVVLVLDDLVEMCDAAGKLFHYGYDVPILVRNGFNSAMRWPVSGTLESAREIALARIDNWKERHAC